MEKNQSSPFSFLFPWLSPRVVKFAFANNGIEVQLWKNERLLHGWHPSQLQRVLPEALTRWMSDCHVHEDPQPYPLVKSLWQALLPLASKKLIIDSSLFLEVEEISQPRDCALVWTVNRTTARIEGHI